MAIDGNRVKRRLRSAKRTGKRVTFYLSEDVYRAFQAHCGDLTPSAVVNELLKEFIASTPGRHKAEYSKLVNN